MVTFEEVDKIRIAYRMSKNGFSEFLDVTSRTYYLWSVFGIPGNTKCRVFLNHFVECHAELIAAFAKRNLSPPTR